MTIPYGHSLDALRGFRYATFMLGKPKYHSQFYQFLLQVVGAEHASIREIDRITYARDANVQSTIQAQAGHFPHHPDIIVWPKGAEEISKILKLARRFRVPIIPYGAGSGVCGGTLPTKGGVILDLKRNDALFELNEDELWIGVETGLIGECLERLLNQKGYTLGHFPTSIYCSTVGGWLATRSAGLFSTRYGKIKDMVLALEIVMPKGEIVITPHVKNQKDAMDWNQFFIGTEGTMGVITKAWLKIHRLPEKRLFRGVSFPSLSCGAAAMREMIQRPLTPTVLELHDELGTLLLTANFQRGAAMNALPYFKNLSSAAFSSLSDSLTHWGVRQAMAFPALFNALPGLLEKRVLLVMGAEGDAEMAERDMQEMIDISLENGGEDRGAAIGDYWYAHRYDVSYRAAPVFFEGGFLDLMVVGATWDKVDQLERTMRQAITPHAILLTQFSHAYHEGCSLHFTFVARAADAPKSEALLESLWKIAIEVCQGMGGAISHHHGIGLLKVEFMNKEWSSGMELLRSFKKEWDAAYRLNPSKLIPYRD